MNITRTRSTSAKKIALIFCLALEILMMSSCRSQVADKDAGTQSGQPSFGTDFLEKSSPHYIRVMSFNVGWDSIFPDDDPHNDQWRQDSSGAAFERILKVVEPDILCLQEINPLRDPQQVGDMLDAALPLADGHKWQAHSGQDNLIAARFQLEMETDQLVQEGSVTDFGHTMALVDFPEPEYQDDLYLICAHFQALGGEANVQARQAHADAIIDWLRDAKTTGGEIDLPFATPILVLGDFNVYDTDPAHHLTTLLSGDIQDEAGYGADIKPDWDETDLADALPHHNGAGEEVYTWRDDTQAFNPGALDRILYTDSVIMIENAFVLNTEIMTAQELATAGLQAGDVMLDPDTGRYDHLPLVVDISFRSVPAEQ